ncbi:hypothetical protein [Agrococcus sediminis]|uniref:hypothetical protein n=1 Tax=Agrococcus sediminis TaxID=2599924 RepID=UPI00343AB714
MHRIDDHLSGRVDIAAESIHAFEENLERRTRFCADRGITYRHIIFPDKGSALRGAYPGNVEVSYTDAYRPFFNDRVLDLEPILSDETSFLFSDTHLSVQGMVRSTLAIATSIYDFDVDRARRDLNDLIGNEYEAAGDLGRKLDPPVTETRRQVLGRYLKRFDNRNGANDGHCIVGFNLRRAEGVPSERLLIFGDSFLELGLPMLSYFFSDVVFCRSRFFHQEMVDMVRPDVVITESAERYFSRVRSDLEAPRFLLYYGVRGRRYPEDSAFYTALNAALNYPGPQYRSFRDALTP